MSYAQVLPSGVTFDVPIGKPEYHKRGPAMGGNNQVVREQTRQRQTEKGLEDSHHGSFRDHSRKNNSNNRREGRHGPFHEET
jgi:hypothetical protein